jgi:hypothetical protein
MALTLVACSTLRGEKPAVPTAEDAGPRVVVLVIKRSWHTDIGFNANDLGLPLASLRTRLPAARYLLFGFGDRHYLMNRGSSADGLLGAVWPGAGVILVTGLASTPEAAFGAANVMHLMVTPRQAQSLRTFIWNALGGPQDAVSLLGAGPYDGSLYYASPTRYSGLHTCNTWTAEALGSAELPVSSFAVELSGQVWRQVRKIARQQAATAQPSASSP